MAKKEENRLLKKIIILGIAISVIGAQGLESKVSKDVPTDKATKTELCNDSSKKVNNTFDHQQKCEKQVGKCCPHSTKKSSTADAEKTRCKRELKKSCSEKPI